MTQAAAPAVAAEAADAADAADAAESERGTVAREGSGRRRHWGGIGRRDEGDGEGDVAGVFAAGVYQVDLGWRRRGGSEWRRDFAKRARACNRSAVSAIFKGK